MGGTKKTVTVLHLNSVDVISCIPVPLNDIIIFILTHLKILESIEIRLTLTLQ